MRRRDFLRKGTIVAGSNLIAPLMAESSNAKKLGEDASQPAARGEIRSPDFLGRQQAEKYVPKMSAHRELKAAGGADFANAAERAAQAKHCSALGFLQLNARSNHQRRGLFRQWVDVYRDSVRSICGADLFHQESLLMPWKRPFEAPKVADIFPQVRQMVLDGKYQEAIEFAFREMDKCPVKVNTWPHPTIPVFMMHLDFSEGGVCDELSPHREF